MYFKIRFDIFYELLVPEKCFSEDGIDVFAPCMVTLFLTTMQFIWMSNPLE